MTRLSFIRQPEFTIRHLLIPLLLLVFGLLSPSAFAAWQPGFHLPGFNDAVTSMVYDGNGNIYVGGQFIAVDGTTVNHIAKWDGST